MTSASTLVLRSFDTRNNPHKIAPNVPEIPGDQVCVLYIGGNAVKTDAASSGEHDDCGFGISLYEHNNTQYARKPYQTR